MQDDENVAPQDGSLRNSAKAPEGSAAPAMVETADRSCYWNDKKYSDGATVCDSGQRYKCWSGRWVDIGNC